MKLDSTVNKKDFWLGFLFCLSIMLFINTMNCGRVLSRIGFGDQKLHLPKDFKTIISVSFHKTGSGETVKDLTYQTINDEIRSVEYLDKPWSLEGSIHWIKSE
jgi:hypothetical protein